LVVTDDSGGPHHVVNNMDVPLPLNSQALARAHNALSYDIVELEKVLTELSISYSLMQGNTTIFITSIELQRT